MVSVFHMRVAVGWALAIILALVPAGCRPGSPTVAEPPDFAPANHLLALMRQRLLLMHDVARWKWNERKPITDPEREKQLLDGVAAKAGGMGLDPEWVRSFFAAQIEAAKVIQESDFARWKSAGQGPFPEAPDLALLRQQIDQLNTELLAALQQAMPLLKPPLAAALDRRIEAELGTELNVRERDIAAEPLRKRAQTAIKGG